MRTLCPSCSASLETPYTLLGAGVTCPACGDLVRPQVEKGTPFPKTGYEITFGDFMQLLTHRAYRPVALPLVKKWAPSVEQAARGDGRVDAGSDQEKVLLEIHRMIQGSSAMQFELYQAAMSLWR